MEPVTMGQHGWYFKSLSEIREGRALVLLIEGKRAQLLRAHFPLLVHLRPGFNWRTVVTMVRFRRLHRLFFSALSLGLGVSMEGDSELLTLRMNDMVGQNDKDSSAVVLRKSRAGAK